MPLTARTVMLAKVESSYGADPTHAATDAALVHDLSYSFPTSTYARATLSPSLTPHRAAQLGKRSIELSFFQYMRGNAAEFNNSPVVVPEYDVFLRACGLSATWVGGSTAWRYAPVSTGFESVAIECEVDGVLITALGCRGNARFVFTPGEPARIEYTFNGLFTAPGDRVTSAPNYTSDIAPPIVASTGFQPWSENPNAGVFGHVGSLVVDMRNQIVSRESLTSGAEGIAAWEIVGRGTADDPGMAATLIVEGKPHANSDDWYTRWSNRTLSGTATATVGSGVAHNEHAFAIENMAINGIDASDLEGRVGYTLDCRIIGGSTGGVPDGNDDFLLTAT